MRQCLSAMNHYIENHESRGWFRKGFTGDQRLEAVKETRMALWFLNRRTEAFGNISPTPEEVRQANAPYEVDGEKLMQKLGKRKGINKNEIKNSIKDKVDIFENNDNIIDTTTNKSKNKGKGMKKN